MEFILKLEEESDFRLPSPQQYNQKSTHLPSFNKPLAFLIKAMLHSSTSYFQKFSLLSQQNSLMRNTIYSLLMILVVGLCPLTASAQYFTKAPKLEKKVHKIIEWMQLDGEVIKANTSYFDKAGNLTGYYNEDDENGEKITLDYDKKGRLLEKRIGSEESSTIIRYAYKKNTSIRQEHYRGKVFKVFEYRNDKGQMVEKKTFLKGGELGEQFILRERFLFHYNDRDSLKGTTHKTYSLDGKRKGKSFETKKTVYTYDKKTGKRSQVIFYDTNGEEATRTQYNYFPDGRIDKIIMISQSPNESNRLVEYQYNADKTLWQEIETTNYKRFVKIYKNKRLIRQRTYIGEELFAIVDFQYVFY